ncbi:transposase, partial [Xanthomonas vasicola pv. musacearum NCPPB 4392]
LSTFTQNIPVEWITSALDLERERSTARDLLARPSHFTQLMKAPGQS